MALYKLRDYQQESLNKLRSSFKQGLTRPILELPTGAGKTVILAHVVASALDKGGKVLFVVPYTALIMQTIRTFEDQGIPTAGVIQGNHELTDKTKRLQVATVQTLQRRKIDDYTLILVDEAHVQYAAFLDYLKTIKTPVIGVTATPYSKGLGRHYNNLLQPISMATMIERGYLSTYTAYSTSKPDMTGVKQSNGDYQQSESEKKMSTPQIMGDIIKTWLRLGNNGPTVCFAVNVSHANFIGSEFDKINAPNQVITAKTPMEDREVIFKDFKRGQIKILINVGTLIAGFDSIVHVIIHARPTKSQIVWKQSVGRGLRINDGKERLILLDHAGNCERLGFPEDYNITRLDTGEKPENPKSKQKEQEEALPKACPKCGFVKPPKARECEQCGFAPRATQDVETIDGELVQISGKKKSEQATMAEKQQFYRELRGYQIARNFSGKQVSDGYLSHLYKARFKVWPKNINRNESSEPSESTLGFIKSRQIAFAKSRSKKNAQQ